MFLPLEDRKESFDMIIYLYGIKEQKLTLLKALLQDHKDSLLWVFAEGARWQQLRVFCKLLTSCPGSQ